MYDLNRKTHYLKVFVLIFISSVLIVGCYGQTKWKEFKYSEGNFSVLLPEKPTGILAFDFELAPEMYVAKFHIDDDLNLEINYAFMYIDYDSSVPFNWDRNASTFFRDIDGFDEKYSITMSGMKGMEYIKENEQVPVRKLRILKNKDGNIYMLIVIFNGNTASLDDVERLDYYFNKFFDSFKVRE